MRRATLLDALPIVASALGRTYGVQVEIGGREALTNGRQIILPSLPVDDQKAALLAYGYLDHEAGHVRLTDFADVQLELQTASALEHQLWNIFEDIRIEKRMGEIYPGCRINLNRLTHQLVADGVFHAPSAQEPVQVLQSYLLHTLRARVLGQEALVPLARVSEKMLAELFSSAVRLKLTGILGKVATLRSSRDALNLAQATIDLLEAASKTKGIPQHDPAGVQMEGSHSQRQVKPGPEGGRNLATGGNGSSHKRFSEKTREKPVPTGDAIHKGRGADSGDTQEGATDSCSNEESPGLEANSSRETRKASIEHRDSSGADALQAILNAAPGDFLPDFGGLLSQQLRKFASRCHRPAVGIETAVLEGPPSATAAEGKALIQDVQIQLVPCERSWELWFKLPGWIAPTFPGLASGLILASSTNWRCTIAGCLTGRVAGRP
jgi:cobaltochelatase CobT